MCVYAKYVCVCVCAKRGCYIGLRGVVGGSVLHFSMSSLFTAIVFMYMFVLEHSM